MSRAKKGATVISIINHKGGVGKTTTVVNVGAALAKKGYKALVVDLDTQMNLTHWLLEDGLELHSIKEVIEREALLNRSIKKTNISGLDILPSNETMVDLELMLYSMKKDAEFSIKNVLKNSLFSDYDFILFDNPPHLGLVTISSLLASQFYFVPVSAEYLPLVGIRNLIRTIDEVKEVHNSIKNLGFLLTMVDRRESISKDVTALLKETFQDKVFESIIRVNTKFKSCPQTKNSIFSVEGEDGRGSVDYSKASEELVNRVNVC